jgi:hypothetical protein
MNDAALVGVLDGQADRADEFQDLAAAQVVLFGVLVERHAGDEFHRIVI